MPPSTRSSNNAAAAAAASKVPAFSVLGLCSAVGVAEVCTCSAEWSLAPFFPPRCGALGSTVAVRFACSPRLTASATAVRGKGAARADPRNGPADMVPVDAEVKPCSPRFNLPRFRCLDEVLIRHHRRPAQGAQPFSGVPPVARSGILRGRGGAGGPLSPRAATEFRGIARDSRIQDGSSR